MAESKEAQGQEQEDHSNSWLGDFVRLTIMIWAMGVITANYLGIFKQSHRRDFQREFAEFNGSKLSVTARRRKRRALALKANPPLQPPNEANTFGIRGHIGGCNACQS